MSEKELEKEMEVWLDHMTEVLASSDRHTQQGFITYGLPHVVELVPGAYFSLLRRLVELQLKSNSEGKRELCPDGNAINGMLGMLKVIKSNLNLSLDEISERLLSKGAPKDSDLSSEICRVLVAASLQSNPDQGLRFIALEVLATTKSSNAPVDAYEMDLLQRFLTYALAERVGTKGKQEVGSVLLRVLYRQLLHAKSEANGAEKKRKRIEFSKKLSDEEKTTMLAELEQEGHPGVDSLLDTVEKVSNRMGTWLYPGAPSNKSHVASFLYCSLLLDVWGVNKEENSITVSGRKVRETDVHLGSFLGADVLNPEKLGVISERNQLALFYCLWDTYDQARAYAYQALCSMPFPLEFAKTESQVREIYKTAITMVNAGLARECDVGSLLLRLLLQVVRHQPELLSAIVDGASCTTEADASLVFVRHVVSLLQAQVEAAKVDLVAVAKTSPLHGLLLTLRYLVSDIGLKKVAGEASDGWREVVASVLTCVADVTEIALQVVGDVAPEGYTAAADQFRGVGDCCSNPDADAAATGTAIMQCSWHSIKGCSLLAATLLNECPLPQQGESESALLSVVQIERLASDTLRVLLGTRHKGALEKTYVGAEAMCKTMLSSRNTELQAIPLRWIDLLFSHIDDPVSVVTRRSAGLPYAFCAVLRAEVVLHRNGAHPVLKRVFDALIERIRAMEGCENSESDHSAQEVLTGVHCYNVMLGMLRDHVLGSEIDEWLPDALALTISGLSSAQWAIRNSATMCFSALMHRFVGPEHREDDNRNSGTQRNMSFAQFFSRVPVLNSFIHGQLQLAAEAVLEREAGTGQQEKQELAAAMHTSMYCLLLLLSRLSASESSSNMAVLSLEPPTGFIDALRTLGGHADYRVREMAARALVPLIPRDQVAPFAAKAFESIPSTEQKAFKSSNRVHGLFLQVLHLLRGLSGDPALKQMASDEGKRFLSSLKDRVWILHLECIPIAKAFGDIVVRVLRFFDAPTGGVSELVREAFPLMRNVLSLTPNAQLPMLATYRRDLARFCIEFSLSQPSLFVELTGESVTDIVITLSGDDAYEVREVSLTKLATHLRGVSDPLANMSGAAGALARARAARASGVEAEATLQRRQLQAHLLSLLEEEKLASVNELILECVLALGLDLPLAVVAAGSLWDSTVQLFEGQSSSKARDSAVRFMGFVVAQTVSRAAKCTEDDERSALLSLLDRMFARWLRAVERTSQSSCRIEERRAALDSVVSSQLLARPPPSKEECNLPVEVATVRAWLVAARLLVDDEEDLRQQCTSYLSSMEAVCEVRGDIPATWTKAVGMSSFQTQECLFLMLAERFPYSQTLFEALEKAAITDVARSSPPSFQDDEESCYFPAEVDNMWEEPLLELQLRMHCLARLVTTTGADVASAWEEPTIAVLEKLQAVTTLLKAVREMTVVSISANGDFFTHWYSLLLTAHLLCEVGQTITAERKALLTSIVEEQRCIAFAHPLIRHALSFFPCEGEEGAQLRHVGLLFCASEATRLQ